MRALKFYDKEGTGYEFYVDYEKQSLMLNVESDEESPIGLEIDDEDIDDIIISLVELKNEIVSIRNLGCN